MRERKNRTIASTPVSDDKANQTSWLILLMLLTDINRHLFSVSGILVKAIFTLGKCTMFKNMLNSTFLLAC